MANFSLEDVDPVRRVKLWIEDGQLRARNSNNREFYNKNARKPCATCAVPPVHYEIACPNYDLNLKFYDALVSNNITCDFDFRSCQETFETVYGQNSYSFSEIRSLRNLAQSKLDSIINSRQENTSCQQRYVSYEMNWNDRPAYNTNCVQYYLQAAKQCAPNDIERSNRSEQINKPIIPSASYSFQNYSLELKRKDFVNEDSQSKKCFKSEDLSQTNCVGNKDTYQSRNVENCEKKIHPQKDDSSQRKCIEEHVSSRRNWSDSEVSDESRSSVTSSTKKHSDTDDSSAKLTNALTEIEELKCRVSSLENSLVKIKKEQAEEVATKVVQELNNAKEELMRGIMKAAIEQLELKLPDVIDEILQCTDDIGRCNSDDDTLSLDSDIVDSY